jgi:hypothetical protein
MNESLTESLPKWVDASQAEAGTVRLPVEPSEDDAKIAQLRRLTRAGRRWRINARSRVWAVIMEMHGQLGHTGIADECFRPWCYELRCAITVAEP